MCPAPLKIKATNKKRAETGLGLGLVLQLHGHVERRQPILTATRPPQGQRSRFRRRRLIIGAPQPSGNNALVPVHDYSIVPPPPPLAVASLAPSAGSSGLQPEGPSVILVPYVGVPWKSGIFDCLQHPANALITTVAPCVTFGQIAEIVDNGSTSCLTGSFLHFFLFLVICHWNIGIGYRMRLRNAFQTAETPPTDRFARTLCPLCSLCQEFRELNYRYQGVIAGILHEQWQQEGEIIPPTSQAMTR
ncbi:hypothetical protein ACJRO7_014396 [Eucalyptus globulus]|uniref:Uncharacterized protein n=1 Tax=Eucalyptus globulus TaxID=34317 RepID=A0ABD3L013_EUCGL